MSENYRSRTERKHAQNQKQETHKTEKPKKKGSFFKKFLIACLLIGIVGLVAGVSAFFVMVKDAPKLDKAKLVNPLSTKFYDKDGKFIYEYGAEKRTNVTYDQIPKVVESAFLATEDARFYTHDGIDFKRTGKAIFENFTSDSKQGGSTITQQVIKNYFLTFEKTSKRKVQEWYLAYKLEQQYSKHEILEMYLNKINLGNRSYGVATAAKNYYGKDLKDLKLHEAAMLAGLPQGPNKYDPTKPENVDDATKRRNIVLTLMNRHNFITKQEMEEAMNIPVTEGLLPSKEATEMPYQGFLDAVVQEIEAEIEDVNIGSDGLSIYTTLDTKAQDHADKIMNTGELVNYPNDEFQGAFVFMDTASGEVRAIGSGRGEKKATFKGHNMAVDLERAVGSTMKPIFDYAPAIEYLKWSTYHQVDDSEYKYSTGQTIRNANGRYEGPMSMRYALQWSKNVPAIKTAQEVGLSKAQGFAQELGLTFGKDGAVESSAIGTNESSPLAVAGAYASFGNGGVYNKPHFVTKVVYPDGKEHSFTPKEKRVMKDYTAYMITDMLRTVVQSGTGKTANIGSLDIAGKTGTTNYDAPTLQKHNIPASANRDSWFAGYTPQYTMAVWTGYEKDSPENYVGANSTQIAPRMFKAMMSELATDNARFEMPNTVYRDNDELYIKGVKKDAVKKTEVAPPTGLKPAYDQASNTITLQWSGPSGVSYSASYKGSDGSSGGLSVSGTSASLGGVKPGVTYSFSVVAKKGNGISDAAGASITIPGESTDDKKKAEEEKRKQNEEAKKKAEEEKRKQQEEEAKKKAEEEKDKQEQQKPDKPDQPDNKPDQPDNKPDQPDKPATGQPGGGSNPPPGEVKPPPGEVKPPPGEGEVQPPNPVPQQ